jgi:hypothetical protein
MKKVLFAIITSHFVKLSVILLSFVFHSLSSIAQVPSYVPTSGLVGWWPFNGNANDESGNGNNGTVNGATLTTDRFGVANKAYNFDGVDDFISLANSGSINFSGGITFSAWVKTNDVRLASIVDKETNCVSYGYRINTRDNGQFWAEHSCYGNGQPGSYGAIASINYTANTWYFIVGTLDLLTGNRIYINGNLVDQGAVTQLINNSKNIEFGRSTLPQGEYFWGKIDDIAIYNRALTQQEITNLYNSSVPPTLTLSSSQGFINCEQSSILTASSSSSAQPCSKVDLPATLQNGLVGYWPFCGNANDASGNGNNGTVNGATLTTDRFGNANRAYSFDGSLTSAPFILTNTPFQVNSNQFSISFWLQRNSLNLNPSWLLDIRSNPLSGNFEIIADDSTLTFLNYNSQINVPIFTINHQIGIVSTNWYHFLCTSSNNITKLYVNSQLVGQSNTPISIPSGGSFFIGKHGSFDLSTNTSHNGKIDDIAIYNRALTASEIQQLYNLGNVSYSWSTGATTPSISVSPTQTTSYTCTATNSAGSTTSSVTVTVADTLTWTGSVDTDWHKACNWSPEFVPKCCNSVKIPLTTNQPIIAGVAASKDITIQTTSGALLTVNNGANLQIQDCPIVSTTNTCPVLALITTTNASSITQTTAVSGGTITYQGSSAITARGVCWSTSPNPTLSNSFSSNGSGIGTFTSNLVSLTGGTTYYVRAYATNGSGTSYGNQVSFVSTTPQPTYPIGSVFCTGSPTLVIDVTNPTTGKTWMDRNLGATQVATSSTDAAAYGDLYQWGRRSDGHHCRNSATTTTLSSSDQPAHGNFILAPNSPYDWRNPQNTNLWQGANGVNNPCPSGYRLPTDTELNSERLSWSNNNSSGAFTSPLKLPAAGRRLGSTGSIGNVGLAGYYWSNVVFLNAWGGSSRRLYFMSSNGEVVGELRNYGFSVRCIKN